MRAQISSEKISEKKCIVIFEKEGKIQKEIYTSFDCFETKKNSEVDYPICNHLQ